MVDQLCGGGIQKQIKTCDGCVHLRFILMKSGKDPIYWNVCDIQPQPSSEFKQKTSLHKNFYGYIEPPGFDGDGCPFHLQLLRDKKIKKIVE